MSVLVLVVDDEPDVEDLFRQQFRRDLRTQRFVMDFANSAADALARIASTIGQSLILILSDINMPGMSGLDLHSHLLAHNKRIPTILITAYPDEQARERALQAGVTCYLAKPFDEEDLIACIGAILGQPRPGC